MWGPDADTKACLWQLTKLFCEVLLVISFANLAAPKGAIS